MAVSLFASLHLVGEKGWVRLQGQGISCTARTAASDYIALPGPIRYANRMMKESEKSPIARRFRGFLPVVVDIETGGFNAKRDALLEIAAVTLDMDEEGFIGRRETIACHVEPFPGSNLDAESLAFTGIDPYNPFRMAKPERDALEIIFKPVRRLIRASGCNRAILVGHNAAFDLSFLNAAVTRTGIKRNPFHRGWQLARPCWPVPLRRPVSTGAMTRPIPPFTTPRKQPTCFAPSSTAGKNSACTMRVAMLSGANNKVTETCPTCPTPTNRS